MFSRAFRSSLKPIELGRRLVREMDAHRTLDVHGRAIVPNVFRFRLSPADHHAFSAIEGPLVRELVDAAKEHARDEGYGFLGPLRVELLPDESLKSGRITLASELSASSRPASGVAKAAAPAAPAPAPAPSPDPVIAPRPIEPQPAPTPDHDPPAWASESVAWGADAAGAAAGTILGGAEAVASAAADGPRPALPDTTVAPSAVPPTVVQAAAPTATLELATGERFDLHPGRPATIGRLPTCEVVVTDPNVSRRHCEVRPAGDGWLVADLGSTNGTRVGGALVQGEQLLHHGDIITIGATRLRFEVR